MGVLTGPHSSPKSIPGTPGSSVTPSPWRLIEVPADTKVVSATSSPFLRALPSPLLKPQSPPRSPAFRPWGASSYSQHKRRSWASLSEFPGLDETEAWDGEDGVSSRAGTSVPPASRPPRPPQDEDDFDPWYLIGDWFDNLGHRIIVASADRRRGGAPGRLMFSAWLQKPGIPDKQFTISKDRVKKEWVCGNGVLVRSESSMEVVTWRAGDGRTSSWERVPPDGPVYFDDPPDLPSHLWNPESEGDGYYGKDGQYYGPQMMAVWVGPDGEMVPAVSMEGADAAYGEYDEGGDHSWNPWAREFVPPDEAFMLPSPSGSPTLPCLREDEPLSRSNWDTW